MMKTPLETGEDGMVKGDDEVLVCDLSSQRLSYRSLPRWILDQQMSMDGMADGVIHGTIGQTLSSSHWLAEQFRLIRERNDSNICICREANIKLCIGGDTARWTEMGVRAGK